MGQTCLQAGAQRHRLQAEGLALSLGSLARLAQDEESSLRCSEAGGRGRLELMIDCKNRGEADETHGANGGRATELRIVRNRTFSLRLVRL
jgi:hypothetical protein